MKEVKQFRFENLTIWQESINIANELFKIAEKISSENFFVMQSN